MKWAFLRLVQILASPGMVFWVPVTVAAILLATALIWQSLPLLPRAAWTYARGAAFTPDGKTFITTFGGYVFLFDAASGAQRGAIKPYGPVDYPLDSPYRLFAVSPDGKLLLVRDSAARVKVYDVATLKECCAIQGESEWYEFSPGSRFVIGQHHTTVDLPHSRVWEATTGRPILPPDQPGKGWPAFSPDDSRILLPPPDARAGFLTLWDWAEQRTWNIPWDASSFNRMRLRDLKSSSRQLPETTSLLSPFAEFSPNRLHLALAHQETVQLLDPETGQERSRLAVPAESQVTAIAFAPDSRFLVGAFILPLKEYALRFWNVETGQELGTVKYPVRKVERHRWQDPFFALMLNSAGTVLVARAGDHRSVWDVSVLPPREICKIADGDITGPGGRVLFKSRDIRRRSYFSEGEKTSEWYYNNEMDISPDGKKLAIPLFGEYEPSEFGEFMAHLFNYKNTQADDSHFYTEGEPVSVYEQVSRASQYKRGMVVKVLDLETGSELSKVFDGGHPHFSPDGLRLATEDHEHGVRLWDIPPRKGRLWRLSLPSAVAFLLVLSVYGLKRRRRRIVVGPSVSRAPLPGESPL